MVVLLVEEEEDEAEEDWEAFSCWGSGGWDRRVEQERQRYGCRGGVRSARRARCGRRRGLCAIKGGIEGDVNC